MRVIPITELEFYELANKNQYKTRVTVQSSLKSFKLNHKSAVRKTTWNLFKLKQFYFNRLYPKRPNRLDYIAVYSENNKSSSHIVIITMAMGHRAFGWECRNYFYILENF